MFLRSNELEQLEFKLKTIIGMEKHAGKVRKYLMVHIYMEGLLTAHLTGNGHLSQIGCVLSISPPKTTHEPYFLQHELEMYFASCV